jgi:phospholipase/carboxylesterase
MSPFGYQWFPLTVTMEGVRSSPAERWQGALSAAPHIDAFLDHELAGLGLDASRLVLVGFSQGAMMALHVGPRRSKSPAAIVSFSGMVLGEEHLGDSPQRPPIFMAHGDIDEIVPFASMDMGAKALRAAGFEVETHIEHGMGHGIEMQAMALAGDFIKRYLAM